MTRRKKDNYTTVTVKTAQHYSFIRTTFYNTDVKLAIQCKFIAVNVHGCRVGFLIEKELKPDL